MPVVKFVNEKKEIEVPKGACLRTEALRAGVQVHPGIHQIANCFGNSMCASCRVLITQGMENAGPPTVMERMRRTFLLAYLGNESSMRLSCQVTVEGDMTVVTQPPLNLFGENFFS